MTCLHHISTFAWVRQHAANVYSPTHVSWHRLQDKTDTVRQMVLLFIIWQHAATCTACTQHAVHSPRTAYVNPTPRAEPASASPTCQECAVLAARAVMSHNLSSCPPVEAAMTCSSSVPRNSACNRTLTSADVRPAVHITEHNMHA